ncbi:sugar isomerase domain-containing protein [Bacillus sp. FJAT-22090]|uniref:sugar isomerase domain-containing protein n=1 Tax=Bacillus sp. FJAT-22090 TaxID=1581038 RepID=UPI0011A4852F|nr:SIS domain-containing protein [Bacillus sp. FJAT-22090]
MQSYFQNIQQLLNTVIEKEQAHIEKAASIIMEKLREGGIVQLFGCGHSHLLAQDAHYRAGGLVPVKPITIEPLMLHKGALTSSRNEKDPNFIKRYTASFEFKKNDVLIVISTSGRNAAPIDVALLAKEAGIVVLSLQSLEYSEQLSRHSSGKRLEEVVDFVLNTHIPVGDGLLSHQGMQYGPASTVVGSTILNTLFCSVIETLSGELDILPVFESANVSSDQSHNDEMIAIYKSRIEFG